MGIMALITRTDGGSSRVEPAACDRNANMAQKVHWMSNIAIGASKLKEDRTALLSNTIEEDTALIGWKFTGPYGRGGYVELRVLSLDALSPNN